MQLTLGRINHCRHRLIAHRQDTWLNAECEANRFRRVAQRLALRKHRRAMNVGGEIAIAEVEPIDAAKSHQTFQRMKRISAVAPPFCLIHDSSERVSSR